MYSCGISPRNGDFTIGFTVGPWDRGILHLWNKPIPFMISDRWSDRGEELKGTVAGKEYLYIHLYYYYHIYIYYT